MIMNSYTSNVLLALESNRVDTYCTLASFTMLLYDHLLTLKQEIELIWPTPWSLGKALYFSRYLAFIDGIMLVYFPTAPSPIPIGACTVLYKITGWLVVGGIIISESILVFRTWAIWGRNNCLAIGLLIFLVILAIPTAIFTYDGLASVEFESNAKSKSCTTTKLTGPIIFLDYVLLVVFESVVLILTVYKGIRHLRHNSSSLVATLYRDGVLYYVYLFAFSLLNIIVLVVQPEPQPSLILMQRILHSIFTARLLLNLREAACRDRARDMYSDGMDTIVEATEAGHRRPRTVLSSVVIGVDTWFRDTSTGMQSTTIELV